MVAVIIPYFRGRNLIDAAVESVINQTDNQWHLYIVDDGSQDGNEEHLRSYSGDQVTVLIHEENIGLYARLRETIDKHIKCEWVTILMQDDRLKIDYVEYAFSVSSEYPEVGAFWFEYDIINVKGEVIKPGIDTGRREILSPSESWYSVLDRGCIWSIYGSFTRSSIFQSHPFRIDLPHCGDYEWLLRFLNEENMIYVERPSLYMMSHKGQASEKNLRMGIDLIEQLKVINDMIVAYKPDVLPSKILRRRLYIASVAGRRACRRFLHGEVRGSFVFLKIMINALRSVR
ncbi:glycosyltransferase [Cyanobium sp. To12R1]|uniref:glycosyltransferase n=1 Tax=Cyanobium sp. To12R1 TaxID=2823723 RepID=UPI0020CD755D|nr:glycosyltransferase [Cyanobium sp. To12R1]MCP9781695.1 glycosyltransferase [Cyanobium sp. To12R1]